jgi:hypothetical protein
MTALQALTPKPKDEIDDGPCEAASAALHGAAGGCPFTYP